MPKQKPEKDLLRIYRQRILRAQENRDAEKRDVWDKNLLSFRGKLRPPSEVWNESDPWICVELVHSSIRSAIPSLLYSNPKWSIEPKKPEFQSNPETPGEMVDVSWEKARSKELWVDHIWRETNGNLQTRLVIESAFLAFGAAKVGYAPDFADDQYRGEIEYDDDGNPVIESYDEETGNPIPKLTKGELLKDKDGRLIFDEDTGMAVPHPGTLMTEKFFVRWVNWENLLFDPEGGNDFKSHRWVAEEWIRPLEQVREDPRLRAKERRAVKASSSLSKALSSDDVNAAVEKSPEVMDEARVRGWDIYDFETGRYYVMAECSSEEAEERFLLNERIPDGYEHGPYCFLKWNEDPGRWYPKTDAEAMAKLELEYNLTRSQMAMHRNQSRSRYLELKGTFDDQDGGEQERTKFAHGESGVIVKVKNLEGIQPARKDALDGSYFVTIPNIKEDFREMAGQPGETVGVADADTATQASLLAASADVRNSDRRDNLVQQFLKDCGAKLLQVAQANSTQVEWVKIRRKPDSDSPFEFIQINPEELDGEFEVSIQVGSTQPKNTQQRVALYERIVTIIAQNPQIAASPALVSRLFEALDVNDEQLIHEVVAIGQIALSAMGLPTSVGPAEGGAAGPGMDGQGQMGAAGGGDMTQVLGQIANQFLQSGNAQQGVVTGAPPR